MSITTQVIWAYGTPSPGDTISLKQQVDLLKNQGLTDGIFIQTPVAEGLMIHRNWTTLNAANDWIAFVSDYNPVSAEITS